jgi:hypothetical protein
MWELKGFGIKKEDVLAYLMKHIMMKIEKKNCGGGRQPASETGELKAGFSKENN